MLLEALHNQQTVEDGFKPRVESTHVHTCIRRQEK